MASLGDFESQGQGEAQKRAMAERKRALAERQRKVEERSRGKSDARKQRLGKEIPEREPIEADPLEIEEEGENVGQRLGEAPGAMIPKDAPSAPPFQVDDRTHDATEQDRSAFADVEDWAPSPQDGPGSQQWEGGPEGGWSDSNRPPQAQAAPDREANAGGGGNEEIVRVLQEIAEGKDEIVGLLTRIIEGQTAMTEAIETMGTVAP